ncbi:MAG: diaminopimelate epimerase [Chlamydiales bacterium]
MTLSCCKCSGAGNTFILIDNREKTFPKPEINLDHDIDGLILLENSSIGDFRMRIFNRDGSEAEMCGNGLCCCVKFLEKIGEPKKKWRVETLGGIQFAWANEEKVYVQMPSPQAMRWNLEVNIGQKSYLLHQLVVGVPHAIHFTEKIETVEINTLGKQLCHHPLFAPARTNVTFVSLSGDKSITIRTYERGVERETSACGTGAVAAALATAKLYAMPPEVAVTVRSGEKLKVCFTPNWEQVTLQGSVKFFE